MIRIIFCVVIVQLELVALHDTKKSYEGSQVWRTILRHSGDAELFQSLAESKGHRMDFKYYPTLDVIEEFMDYLGDNFKSICHVQTIGETVENRPIRMLKISNGDPTNTAILLQGGIHPREWASITSALYIAKNIATKYIIPVINPDGYVYTHTHDRLWRKNRSRNKNVRRPQCIGVDLNRNFGKYWVKSNQIERVECEEDFPGTEPFTEPESRAVKHLLEDLDSKGLPLAFVDFHTYGELILYPCGIVTETSPHIEKLRTTAEAMAQSMYKATHHKYKYGTPPEMIYEAHGTAIDWCHSAGVPLSYAIESRDTGTHAFFLPPDQIEETGKELLGAVRALAKSLEPNYTLRRANHELIWF